MIPPIRVTKVVYFREIKYRMVITRAWEEGELASCCLMGIELLFCKVHRILESGFILMWMYLTILNCTLKNDKDGLKVS